MGADSARALSEDGYKVGILSSSGKAEALAKQLDGVSVTGTNKSTKDLQKLVDIAMDKWGRVDFLPTCWTRAMCSNFRIHDDDWHEGMEIYFLSAVRPTRLVTPIMQSQKSGVIVNI